MSRHVYGPVASRRLGRSLGIDLVPFKTCPFDCIYCQLGRTIRQTLERREWVPLEDVLDELEERLPYGPDVITLSGCGEPTLHSRMGELIDRIKKRTTLPVAVLTNSSLLWQDEVRAQLLRADVICPSLDAGDEETFRAVNRPHRGIAYEEILYGLHQLRHQFRGQMNLEILLLESFTATEEHVAKLAQRARAIHPDRIQLNTTTRPHAGRTVIPVPARRLAELADLFDPPAEVISTCPGPREATRHGETLREVAGVDCWAGSIRAP
jgi:wyosine [tRNA(Phe)-imidazoG37] synthetase (radical SAM superfamily)